MAWDTRPIIGRTIGDAMNTILVKEIGGPQDRRLQKLGWHIIRRGSKQQVFNKFRKNQVGKQESDLD